MQRIVIIGTTGAGKSTLARQLAEKLNLSYIDLDDLHHMPGWRERPLEDYRRLLTEATHVDKWVVAGNYMTKSHDIILPSADTLIWLDMPFTSNLWQLFKRTINRIYSGEPVCNGNKETLLVQLSKESILLWFFKTWGLNRIKHGEKFGSSQYYPHVKRIHLQSYKQARDFLDKIG